jgi:hypothetical protein
MQLAKFPHLVLLLLAVSAAMGCASMLRAERTPAVCPIHGAKLEWTLVPTAYGLIRLPPDYIEASKGFPYPATISARGCVVGLFSWLNRHDWVRTCPGCTLARKTWEVGRAARIEGNALPQSAPMWNEAITAEHGSTNLEETSNLALEPTAIVRPRLNAHRWTDRCNEYGC